MQFPIDKLKSIQPEMENISRRLNALAARASAAQSIISFCYGGGGVGGRAGAVGTAIQTQALNISLLAEAAAAAADAYLIAQDNICARAYALSKKEYVSTVSDAQKAHNARVLNMLGENRLRIPIAMEPQKSSKPLKYLSNFDGATCTTNAMAMQLSTVTGKEITANDLGGRSLGITFEFSERYSLALASCRVYNMDTEELKTKIMDILTRLPEGKQVLTLDINTKLGVQHYLTVYLDENNELWVNDPGLHHGEQITLEATLNEWKGNADVKDITKNLFVYTDLEHQEVLMDIDLQSTVYSAGKMIKNTKT